MARQQQIAVVTGGTGALGRAVVKRFVADGYHVHVPWVLENELPLFKRALSKNIAQVTVHRTDLADPRSVGRFFAAAGGRVDVLAALAGGFVW